MRRAGILMHISSLPSPYGIGALGKEAYDFVDFLEEAGQSYWQILPLGQTGFGDSPYQSCSVCAGNPYFIDLEQLRKAGYLRKKEIEEVSWYRREDRVDYAGLYEKRYPLFRKAFRRFAGRIPADYDEFCWEQGQWLEDYALFMAIKTDHNGASWDTWEEDLRKRDPQAIDEAKKRLGEEMFFWKMLQYFFFRQWMALKEYANGKGIRIIGDLPIYVARDGVDVWSHPELFDLDEDLAPREVAGCPPDAFSADGQLWGNPLYLWKRMKDDGYSWWMDRIRHTFGMVDVVRIDHFRGFEAYYCIPAGNKTAAGGYWRKGPGMDFFHTVRERFGEAPIIAENLGFLTPGVRKLLRDSGYPGMKVLQFAFDSDAQNEYLPQNDEPNSVIYTGTHDNDTILGWLKSISPDTKARFHEYVRSRRGEGANWAMMRAAWESVSDTAIVTMQDLLGLPGTARMNFPSTSGTNWMWRAKPGVFTEALAEKIHTLMAFYNRLPQSEPEDIPKEMDDETAVGDILGAPTPKPTATNIKDQQPSQS